MKKLLFILLPMFVVISIFFHMKNETFNFSIFLDIIRGWSFDNGYLSLLEIKSMFEESLTYLRVGSNNGDFTMQVEGIFNLLKSLLFAPYYLFEAILFYLSDLVHNLGLILDFLLF